MSKEHRTFIYTYSSTVLRILISYYDVLMGVIMQAEGLSGPLCWAVSLANSNTSVRIQSAETTAPEGELAAAKEIA